MELLLIRHALPVRRELDSGAADPALSSDGHTQATLLAEYLASEHLDAVYSSPLRRALQTAAPVAECAGLEVVVRPGVAEWDQDASEYVPVEELKAAGDPRWEELLTGVWSADGETPEQFVARVLATIEEIVAAHRSERVAVVCHGGVIGCYLGHVIGIGTSPPPFFYPNYTSIHRVAAATSGERSIVTLNETGHLRGSGLPMGLFQKG